MASDDIVVLDDSSNSDRQGENNLTEADSVPDADPLETDSVNGEREEGEHVLDMDLESDAEHEQDQPIIEESVGVVESVVKVEKLKEVQPEKATVSGSTATKLLIDEGSAKGVKRARTASVDQQPCVRVAYNLTRESKQMLMQLMQQWSEWHAQFYSSSTVSSEEALEYGEETYFPALHVGSEKTSAVSFWVDKQPRNEDINSIKLEDSVPLYDRGCTLGSTSLGGPDESERFATLEASRCYNCGSYSHSLKECTKPRNNATISSARKQHNSKRNSTPGSVKTRYYQKPQGKFEKFDDIQAGVLGPELRNLFGIGELDPPPWLHRMRELGYPPGYLDFEEDDDQPSGISIFPDEKTTEKEEFEDGELPEKADPAPPKKKMSVQIPGINAPIPENADHHRWANPPSTTLRNQSSYHQPNRLLDHQRHADPRTTEHRSGSGYRSSDLQRVQYTDHRRNDVPAPPGTELGLGSSYSPRYGSYDYNSSPHTISPDLRRSLSDRGWRSSTGYEGLMPAQSLHSPYPYPPGSQQILTPPARSQQILTPPARSGRWSHDNPFGTTSDASSTGRERQEPRHYHQHHQHGRHHRN